jgi:glycosyltransferase involved in cell wall biosynthesis
MRICLVAHGFPPEERTGVENYTAALAAEFVRAGHWVEVFAPTHSTRFGDLAMRREVFPEGYGLTRITLLQWPKNPTEALDPPGISARFAEWLDRERPDVVHFQHVIKLGLGLIEAAHERRIPIIYTAHDFYPICHRYTLLRPDLSICPNPEGQDVCARCDLATAVLNAEPKLGDYQMGVAPADLPKPTAARLAGVLAGDVVADGGFHADEWARARRDRATLDARRREVFAKVNLCVVPSAFMGERMASSGMSRVEYIPYGIPSSDLTPLRKSAPVGRGDVLRIGFIGGLSKHKGIDVLLEAFNLLMRAHPAAASLAVYGYSSDKVYVASLERLAREVGATWKGAYHRADLPQVLAELDVVVVPSTWYENAPIAIREAFAAGRPVVASRLGALGESVRDGVDGLLFEPGSPKDLQRVLATLLDASVLRKLAAKIEPVVSMVDNAERLVARYGALIDANEARIAITENVDLLPASMASFVQAVSKLERAPMRELFEHVSTALGQLGRQIGVPAHMLTSERLIARAFADGDEAQSNLRDMRHELEWLRRALVSVQDGARSQAEYADWARATLDDRNAAILSLEAQLSEAQKALASQEQKVAWLESNAEASAAAQAALQDKADWLQTNAEASAAAQAALQDKADWLQTNVEASATTEAALKEKAEWLEGNLAGESAARAALEAERDALLTAKAGLVAENAWLQGLRGELEAERDWLRGEVAAREAERDEQIAAAEQTRATLEAEPDSGGAA